jgi:uncharacterized protein with HEPN domain
MSDRDSTYLSHIDRAVRAIDEYLSDVTEASFGTKPMVRDAVLRNLEVISEASRRLSDELKQRYPDVPWRGIAAAGNIYRHNYDIVDDTIVWQTATTGLDTIRLIVQEAAEENS